MHTELFNSNPVLKHSFDFALAIVDYCDVLQSEKHFVISNQLLKSGTSIGANVMEAQNAESKADFIHKMKIAAKEAGETQYWLMLCNLSKNIPIAASYLRSSAKSTSFSAKYYPLQNAGLLFLTFSAFCSFNLTHYQIIKLNHMWQETNNSLYRKFEFKDFSEAFAFMARVALVAEKMNHHPRWTNVWNTVEVWLNTHDAGDVVTDKDRKLAEKIDGLL